MHPVQGYGYFKGDVGDVPDEVAARMVESGAVILHQGEDPVSLPEGMPARKILHDNGFRTVAEVLAAREALTEIPGIGKKMAENIVKYCEEYEGRADGTGRAAGDAGGGEGAPAADGQRV